jgi:hypothetical protein
VLEDLERDDHVVAGRRSRDCLRRGIDGQGRAARGAGDIGAVVDGTARVIGKGPSERHLPAADIEDAVRARTGAIENDRRLGRHELLEGSVVEI